MGLIDNATKTLRSAGRIGTWAAGRGLNVAGTVRGRITRSGAKELDDTTLTRKVETEIFRSPTVPKGKIDVNAVDGVVYLRGTAKNPGQLKAIEARARAIPEVRDVENLLHLPKTPARRPKAKKTTTVRTKPRSVNADKTSPRTSDSPAQVARQGKGRAPAKLSG